MERETENLRIEEKEDVELVVGPEDLNNVVVDIGYELCFIGKFIEEKVINFSIIE